jgi:tyrosyl-tRNA synthetase
MTEVRFGDFVLGIDRRMLFRHEFLIQNGGTDIVIGENIQCNSDRASSIQLHHPLLPTMKGRGQKFPVTTSGHGRGHPLMQNIHIGCGAHLAPNSVCAGLFYWE